MKRSDATLLRRYAAGRGLRSRALKRRWAELPPASRRKLRAEMLAVIARNEAAAARHRVDEAFAKLG